MVKITLDAETFKALASSTRLTVLRALDQRRKTLTELARDLDLNKATVHEHLQLLTAADLIRKRDDEGRKWIYYELTWRGQRLMHPQETTTFNVLLGLGVAAAGGGLTMLGRALGWWLQTHPIASSAGDASPAAPQAGLAADQDTTAGTQSSAPPGSSSGAPNAAPGQTAGPAHDSLAATKTGGAPGQSSSHSFFDDGGVVAIMLLCMTALFVGLAMLLRRQVRPGRFSPQAAAAAETPAPSSAPGPSEAKR